MGAHMTSKSPVLLQSDPGCPETPWAAEATQGRLLQASRAVPHLGASIQVLFSDVFCFLYKKQREAKGIQPSSGCEIIPSTTSSRGLRVGPQVSLHHGRIQKVKRYCNPPSGEWESSQWRFSSGWVFCFLFCFYLIFRTVMAQVKCL